ncbi:hypothetical protein [Effusibacillus lacus]|uniref:hypothetical protein n=1 Tax=Effusibacillus lacus TaxID=1348429 RepID=UPI000BB7EA59|nr:hypothetical protein [Effusibacillus lacus]TCS74420.1 hypothetical protein EDD64_11321 [Effusibacillus lacus]
MHRVAENEQIELLYDCADRCKRCQEYVCKQPAYVEVVYCPRFVAIESPGSKGQTSQKKPVKRISMA